jgi:hypothetical protein
MQKMLIFQREVFNFNIYTRNLTLGHLPHIQEQICRFAELRKFFSSAHLFYFFFKIYNSVQEAYLPEITRMEQMAAEMVQVVREVFWQRRAQAENLEGEAYRLTVRDLRNLKRNFEDKFDYNSRVLGYVYHIELPVVQ